MRKDFFSSLCVQTDPGFHPASCTVGTGSPFPGAIARPERTGRPGDRGSIPGRGKRNFSIASVSRQSLGSTQPPVQWVPGVLSPGLKRGRNGLDDPEIEVRSPVEAKGFFLYPLCPDTFWGPPSLLYNRYNLPPYLFSVSFLGDLQHSCTTYGPTDAENQKTSKGRILLLPALTMVFFLSPHALIDQDGHLASVFRVS
jgi:hypothetical protein